MCSERDDIHWFVPYNGPAAAFDIVVSRLDPGEPDIDTKAATRSPAGDVPMER